MYLLSIPVYFSFVSFNFNFVFFSLSTFFFFIFSLFHWFLFLRIYFNVVFAQNNNNNNNKSTEVTQKATPMWTRARENVNTSFNWITCSKSVRTNRKRQPQMMLKKVKHHKMKKIMRHQVNQRSLWKMNRKTRWDFNFSCQPFHAKMLRGTQNSFNRNRFHVCGMFQSNVMCLTVFFFFFFG